MKDMLLIAKGVAVGTAIAFVAIPTGAIAAIGCIKFTVWLIHVIYGVSL